MTGIPPSGPDHIIHTPGMVGKPTWSIIRYLADGSWAVWCHGYTDGGKAREAADALTSKHAADGWRFRAIETENVRNAPVIVE